MEAVPVASDRSYDRLGASGSSSGRGGGSPRPARSTWPRSRDYDPDIPLYALIREGLITGEHVDRMGMALWLYEYLQLRCYFTGPQAGTSVATYTHLDASKVLNRSVLTVKRWMETLVDEGYVTTVRVNQGLVVTITKYGQEPLLIVKPSDIGGTQSDMHVTLVDEQSDISGKQSDISGQLTGAILPEQSDISGKQSDISGQLTGAILPEQSDISGKQSDISGKQSDISGQPLIYVARALRDSEISETPPPLPL